MNDHPPIISDEQTKEMKAARESMIHDALAGLPPEERLRDFATYITTTTPLGVAHRASYDAAVDALVAERDTLLAFLQEIKSLASDPFLGEMAALRACLLAANEALGLPGPQPSPERDVARAVLHEMQSGGEAS